MHSFYSNLVEQMINEDSLMLGKVNAMLMELSAAQSQSRQTLANSKVKENRKLWDNLLRSSTNKDMKLKEASTQHFTSSEIVKTATYTDQDASPSEIETTKKQEKSGLAVISKEKTASQANYKTIHSQTAKRYGSPKPNPLSKLKNVFQRDNGYKSPLREMRLGSNNASQIMGSIDKPGFNGIGVGRKTEDNTTPLNRNTSFKKGRPRDSRLNKDYKSMNNLLEDLTKKNHYTKAKSRIGSPKLSKIPSILDKKPPRDLIIQGQNREQALEEKNAQLEIRVSELVLQNTLLQKKIEEIQHNLKNSQDKIRVEFQ